MEGPCRKVPISNLLKIFHGRQGKLLERVLKNPKTIGMIPTTKRALKVPLYCVRCAERKSHAKSYKNDQQNPRSERQEQENFYNRILVAHSQCIIEMEKCLITQNLMSLQE